ncbi:MAG: hypothetical protein AB1668_07340 [Nanoarchaeota archaeon]
MITQKMLYEIELAMLRAYARASHKIAKVKTARKETNATCSGSNATCSGSNSVNLAASKDNFMREFSACLKKKRNLFEKEIAEGGYREPARLADMVYNLIESRLSSELTQKFMAQKGLDENSFKKVVSDLKLDLREVFYENYFKKR